MAFEDFKIKPSITLVYTGEGKGKTSAGLGLLARGLGTGWRCAFVQFIKHWKVGEHEFLESIANIYDDRLLFHKGGKGFFDAGELSAKSVDEEEHRNAAIETYELSCELTSSGEWQLVVCDEINNAVADGLLTVAQLQALIDNKHPDTNLCLTGRNFPNKLLSRVDIATDMQKIKHHFDDKFLANPGIDY